MNKIGLITGVEKLYGVKVIPSDGIRNGFKLTIRGASIIFISSQNYNDIKDVADAKGLILGISFLQEINSVTD